jgi:phosphonate transport system substrate-binding protein
VPTITKAGTAIADCLSKLTGLTYKIEVGTSFGASIEAMGANKAQISFLNTFSILLAQQKYNIVPVLVSLRTYKGKLENFYQGQFIANKKANIKTIADLKGKTFCYVEPNSTSGYIIPQIVLKANGINVDKDFKATQNAGSHDNVAIAVYKGDCDAGATFVDVRTDSAPIKASYPDILDKVDAFFITDNIPNDGLQVTKDFDPKLRDATVNGMMFISNDAGGKVMLLQDPDTTAGLDELLKKWKIGVESNIVVDSSGIGQLLGMGPAAPLVTTYESHPITKDLTRSMTFFPFARSVKTVENTGSAFSSTVLFKTSEASWGETNLKSGSARFDEGADVKGPVPLGVASTMRCASTLPISCAAIWLSRFATGIPHSWATAANQRASCDIQHRISNSERAVGKKRTSISFAFSLNLA